MESRWKQSSARSYGLLISRALLTQSRRPSPPSPQVRREIRKSYCKMKLEKLLIADHAVNPTAKCRWFQYGGGASVCFRSPRRLSTASTTCTGGSFQELCVPVRLGSFLALSFDVHVLHANNSVQHQKHFQAPNFPVICCREREI